MPGPVAPFIRFHKLIKEDLDTGCWNWDSITGSSGYGNFKAFGKMVSAHRFAYELYKGAVPEGMEILHLCHNRICVNPEHLRIGSHAENMAETIGKPRTWSKSPGRAGILNSQSCPVLVLGHPYGSINEAERSLGLGRGTVRYWIKNTPSKAKMITREHYAQTNEET